MSATTDTTRRAPAAATPRRCPWCTPTDPSARPASRSTGSDPSTTPRPRAGPSPTAGTAPSGCSFCRLGTAALLAVTGLQKIDQRPGTVTMLRTAGLPAPDVLGGLLGPVQLAMAAALVLGVAVRLVGLGLLAQSVVALVLVDWSGRVDVFLPGVSGFTGERQVLLAAIGAALLGLGGGGLGLDRRVRARRAQR